MMQLPMYNESPVSSADGPNTLGDYDFVLVNSSAGKDSQVMLDVVVERARREGVMDRVVMVHADLGRIEWPGTLELAHEHAKYYNLRFEVVRRAQVGDLLAEIRRRGKWPSSTERYCTSYYKRDQVKKLVTRLDHEVRRRSGKYHQVEILNCLGFRAEESPRRRKLPPFAINKRSSSQHRTVMDWLPIHTWTVAEVWARIAQAGTRPHPAYAIGMTRLSCRFCIFAPRAQLMLSAIENPELFEEYVQAERDMKHTFRVGQSLAEIKDAIAAGERPAEDDGKWNM